MIPFFVVMAVIVWLALQGRASRTVVWERRWSALAARLGPFARHIAADVRAVRKDIKVWRFHRKLGRRWDV